MLRSWVRNEFTRAQIDDLVDGSRLTETKVIQNCGTLAAGPWSWVFLLFREFQIDAAGNY
jgi:hypothetical protein